MFKIGNIHNGGIPVIEDRTLTVIVTLSCETDSYHSGMVSMATHLSIYGMLSPANRSRSMYYGSIR